MARILPSDLTPLQFSLGEAAELRTLDLLRRTLPNDYTVYHSVHWSLSTAQRSMYGEADFVVVNRAGEVVVVEQKAGGLVEGAGGLEKVYDRGPGKRVAPQIQRTLDGLRKQFYRQTGLTLALDYLFYCPDHRVRDPLAAGISVDRIVDARDADRIADRIAALIGPGREGPDAQRVHRFFEQTYHLVPDIHTHLREGERAMTRLAGGLADAVGGIEMVPLRLRVRGTAGCGKSSVAVRFMEMAVAVGRRPLLVCFNRPLAERMKAVAPEGATVSTFHGHLDRFLQACGQRLDYGRIGEPGFWTEVQNRVIAETIPPEWRFGSLIVDEGQDFEAEWFDILGLFIADDADILWLEDPHQAIRRDAGDRTGLEERFAAQHFVGYRTQANFRSPQSIAAYIADRLPSLPFVAANPLPGLGVGQHRVGRAEEQAKRAGAIVADLRGQGFAAGDIVVLSLRGLTSASLASLDRIGNFTLSRPTGGYDLLGNQLYSAGQIRFETIHRFKGQEAPAIILTDIPTGAKDAAQEEYNRRLLFTAMTRASVRLEVIDLA